MLRACHAGIWDLLADPTYVLDQPHIHTAVRWEQLGDGAHPIVPAPQPPRSPDFNRPVEHFHHSVKQEFRNLLLTHAGPRSLEGYWRLLQRAYSTCYKRDSAMKDILGLPDLWRWVASTDPKHGSAGDYAPARLR